MAAPAEKADAVEAKLSGPEMVKEAEATLAEFQKAVEAMEASFEEAQGANDTLRANCLGERLGEMKGLVKTGTEAKKALSKAVAGKDDAAAAREYQKIVGLKKKAGQVQQGAAECAGEDGTAGEPGIPEAEETTVQPQAIPFGRAPAASPTL